MAIFNYAWSDIEKMIASGDVKGKLSQDDLPTPALLLDLDLFEFNVHKMIQYVRKRNLSLRPHGKAHKCPEIAKKLIQAGAVGACAAKISEAEVFADHGIGGLLITTEVVGKHKIERAVRLASRRPETIFSVDHERNVRDMNEAAGAAGVCLNLAIDLLVCGRTGVTPGIPALALVQLIDTLPYVKFAGIQAYSARASHVAGWEARREAARASMTDTLETGRLLKNSGIAVPLLSGGSTGTYNIESELDGITELQPGSFIFMDVSYNHIGGKTESVFRDFRNSLTVLTTVISKPAKKFAVVDAGYKSFATDEPFLPETKDIPGLLYTWGGDEHGMLDLTNSSTSVDLGDRLEFIVPHCDPTVNLYDHIFCLRGKNVESVWKIAARGMSQ